MSLWMIFIFATGLLFGVIAGASIEWNILQGEIRRAYGKQEELRGVIYALNHKLPLPSKEV